MRCPKCQSENPETAQFCLRCHTPVRFICPACHQAQDHGGKCDKCGTDFAKYATMMVFQNATQVKQEREKAVERSGMLKQLLLLPLTGGIGLIRYLLARARQ